MVTKFDLRDNSVATACTSECSEENGILTANAELFSRKYVGFDHKKQMFTWAGDIKALKESYVDKILTWNRLKCSIMATDLPHSRRNWGKNYTAAISSGFLIEGFTITDQ